MYQQIVYVLLAGLQFCSLSSPETEEQIFTNLDLLTDNVFNESTSYFDFAMQIQAIFCPAQPICNSAGHATSNDVINKVVSTLNTSNTIITPENIHMFFGICCLNCSCEERCLENDNCCLTRQIFEWENKISTTDSVVKSDCIAATSASYLYTSGQSAHIPRYPMLMKCFSKLENNKTIAKCEKPNVYKLDEIIPHTSLRTGRTYWNKYCAHCNNDSGDYIRWNAESQGHFRYIYFSNKSNLALREYSLAEFQRKLKYGKITYTKPNGININQCLRKDDIEDIKVRNETAVSKKTSFLIEACERFFSPTFVKVIRKSVFKNIFCFLYANQYDYRKGDPRCSLYEESRNPTMSLAALLNFEIAEGSVRHQVPMNVRQHHETCPCNNIFDIAQGKCRKVYCPPDEALENCNCTKFIYPLSGIPVGLKLKIRPEAGYQLPVAETDIRKITAAIKKSLQKKCPGTRIDMMATFAKDSGMSKYLLNVAVARTSQGYDTKESFRQLAESLDGSPFLHVKAKNSHFEVIVSNKIALWKESLVWHAKDIEDKVEMKLLFDDGNKYLDLLWLQELSPLLYCKQVELEPNEYNETDGILIRVTSSPQYNIVNYYHTVEGKVRVCVEDFVRGQAARALAPHKFVLIAFVLYVL